MTYQDYLLEFLHGGRRGVEFLLLNYYSFNKQYIPIMVYVLFCVNWIYANHRPLCCQPIT